MYEIVRFYKGDRAAEVIETGLTLAEAQAHCKDPETSSSTCTEADGLARTAEYGDWFDGYQEGESLECLDEGGPYGACSGEVEYRERISDGKTFPRCEGHAEAWYERQAENARRYPVLAPSDFDPAYAGERWDED
jgi:hypothetical protein